MKFAEEKYLQYNTIMRNLLPLSYLQQAKLPRVPAEQVPLKSGSEAGDSDRGKARPKG